MSNSKLLKFFKYLNVNVLKYRKILFSLIIVFICFLPVMLDFIYNNKPYSLFEVEMLGLNEKNYFTIDTGEINENNKIIQSFLCEIDSISSIEIKACVYDSHNNGLHIELVDDILGTIIEDWDIYASDIREDTSILLKCSTPLSHFNMKDRIYRLEIEPITPSKNSGMGLYELTTDIYPYGELVINDHKPDYDLVMKISGYNGIMNMERVRVWLSLYKVISILLLLYWMRTKIVSL